MYKVSFYNKFFHGKRSSWKIFPSGFALILNPYLSYDIYLTKEPGIFESMALVHSRVGRVFFGVENREEGGLGGTGSDTSLHCLPGTNHRFRAFKCLFRNDIQLLESPDNLICVRSVLPGLFPSKRT